MRVTRLPGCRSGTAVCKRVRFYRNGSLSRKRPWDIGMATMHPDETGTRGLFSRMRQSQAPIPFLRCSRSHRLHLLSES